MLVTFNLYCIIIVNKSVNKLFLDHVQCFYKRYSNAAMDGLIVEEGGNDVMVFSNLIKAQEYCNQLQEDCQVTCIIVYR